MSLSTSHNNTITFSNVNASGSTASLDAALDIYMSIEGVPQDLFDDFGNTIPAARNGTFEFQNTGGNTWRMDSTRITGTSTYTIITLTSSTTANVERYDDSGGISYRYSYTLTKQDS